MFLSNEELETIINEFLEDDLSEYGLEQPLPAELVEAGRNALRKQMVEAVGLENHPIEDGQLKLGGNRLGGRPDLSSDFEWPRSEGEGNLPIPFIAQINLDEIQELGLENNALPTSGRLLFFYDALDDEGIAGHELKTYRVFWDQSAPETLETVDIPKELIEAHENEFGDWPNSVLLMDPQEIQLHKALRTLGEDSPELEDFLDEVDSDDADGMAGLLNAFYWEKAGPFPDIDWHRNQMFGVPICEQGDPRRDVAGAEGTTKASDWQLLAQFGIDTLLPETGDGSIYFLIPKKDLVDSNFARVRAVYQQT